MFLAQTLISAAVSGVVLLRLAAWLFTGCVSVYDNVETNLNPSTHTSRPSMHDCLFHFKCFISLPSGFSLISLCSFDYKLSSHN